MQDIRNLVYLSLLNCIENDRYSNLEADSRIEKNALQDRDRAFFTALFYGVIEKQITLDYQIKKLIIFLACLIPISQWRPWMLHYRPWSLQD